MLRLLRNVYHAPSHKDKIPITMEELEDLVRMLAKYIATNKGANLQKTDPEAHALLVGALVVCDSSQHFIMGHRYRIFVLLLGI